MAITVVAIPHLLTWANFTIVTGTLTDPHDGSTIDAYTAFNYNLPAIPAQNDGGMFKAADPNTIIISPIARVRSGVAQTAALLAHEQFHYDVGIVTARGFARHLAALRAPNIAALRTKMQDAANLHFGRRAGLLQARYDADTRHGTNAHYQRIWKNRMAQCLANPSAQTLGGFYL